MAPNRKKYQKTFLCFQYLQKFQRPSFFSIFTGRPVICEKTGKLTQIFRFGELFERPCSPNFLLPDKSDTICQTVQFFSICCDLDDDNCKDKDGDLRLDKENWTNYKYYLNLLAGRPQNTKFIDEIKCHKKCIASATNGLKNCWGTGKSECQKKTRCPEAISFRDISKKSEYWPKGKILNAGK